jgi:hypothetical protein
LALPFENVLTDLPIQENKLSIYTEGGPLLRGSDTFLQTAKKFVVAFRNQFTNVSHFYVFTLFACEGCDLKKVKRNTAGASTRS